jgi:hypothetical protein
VHFGLRGLEAVPVPDHRSDRRPTERSLSRRRFLRTLPAVRAS